MTDIIYDFISTGVDLILIGGILSSLVIMLRGSAQLTSVISNQQATTTELDYYLQYHKYNDTKNLSSADAMSALVGYRSDMNVFIIIPDGGGGSKTIYNVPSSGKYYCKSNYDPSTGDFNTTGATLLTYDDVATMLNSTWFYNSYLCTSADNRFKKADFDRNTVVTAVILIHTSLDA